MASADPLAALRAKYGSSAPDPMAELRAKYGTPEAPVDDRTFVGKAADTVVPMALRVGGGIVGGVVGGVAGIPALGVGAVGGAAAGGAVGSGLGETAAEAYEVARGLRSDLNPTQIAVQTALGAVPVVGKTGSVAKTVLSRGAQGAVLGGVSSAATDLAEGQRPTVGRVAQGAALGGVLGGGLGAVESRLNRSPLPDVTPPAPVTPTEKIVALREAQNATPVQPGILDKAAGVIRDARTHFVNRFHELDRTMREVGIDPLRTDAAANPSKQIDLALGGAAGKVEAEALRLRAIMDDASKAGLDVPLQDYLNLRGLKHGAETLEAKGVDVASGTALPKGLTPADLDAELARWKTRTDLTPNEKGAVEGLADRAFAVARRALDTTVSAGLVSDEVAATLKARGEGYVPLNRILDDVEESLRGTGRNVDVASQSYLKALNGSSRDTQHPLMALMQKSAIAVQESARNTAMQQVVDLPGIARVLKPSESPARGEGLLTVFQNGQPVRHAVPEPLALAFKDTDPRTSNLIVDTLRAFGGVFRAGTTTANFAFALPNVVKDVADLAVLSNQNRALGALNPKLWQTWAASLKSVVTKDPEYLRFLDSGAAFSTFQRNVDDVQKAIGLRPDPHPFASFAQAGAWLKDKTIGLASRANNALEEATKLTALKTFEGQGLSPTEAAWRTRRFGGSPDYARRGASMQTLNTVVPFLNAQVQAVSRAVDYARLHPEQAATAAAAVTAKLAVLYAWNASFRDPDGTRSWDKVTPREKQGNWILFVPGQFVDPETGQARQNYLKVPVGHAVDAIRSPLTALLDPATRNVTDVANSALAGLPLSPQIEGGVGRSALNTVVSSVNPVIRVPAEQFANRDTFRDVPIVPKRLEEVAPQEQYTATTSPTARAVGRATGVSPVRLEHAVRGFTGGVGGMALSMADSLQGKTQKPVTEIPGLKQVTEAPIVGGVARPIVQRFVGGPASVDATANAKKSAFYRTLEEATVLRNTVNKLVREGRTAEAMAMAASPRSKTLFNMAGRLNTLSQQIAALRRSGAKDVERQALDAITAALAEIPEE